MKERCLLTGTVILVACMYSTVLGGFALDTEHTWIVSTDENDPCYPSHWHPQGYPLDLKYSAGSVSAVLNYAADGDVIYVFPGTYSESVDMNSLAGIRLEGIGKGVKISCSSGDTIKLGDKCELRNLHVICDCNSGYSAISAEDAEDVMVTDCIAEHRGAGQAIYFEDCNSTGVVGSVLKSRGYGIYIQDYVFDGEGPKACHKLRDTQVICTDCNAVGRGVYVYGEAQVDIESCLIRVVTDDEYTNSIGVHTAGPVWLNVSGSSIYSGYNATTGLASKTAFGIFCGGITHLTDTLISTQEEAGTEYTVYTTGTVYISASGFDNDPNKVAGTIIYTADMGP